MAKLLFCFFFCFLLLSFKAASHDVGHEEEFNYEKGTQKGPTHWGDIKPEWRTCKVGLMQSPIDLLHERVGIVTKLGDLTINYKAAAATIINRGHDILLKWVNGAGHINIGRTLYTLKQCHWHSPSEHTIDGKRFDLEAHLVHENANGEFAVIGILYQIGEPNSFLSRIKEHLQIVSNTFEEEKSIGIIDPNLIKVESKEYYRYMGSLTVPPCTENVTWTLLKEVQTISDEQLKLVQAAHDNSNANSRPLQPIHNRTTELKISDKA